MSGRHMVNDELNQFLEIQEGSLDSIFGSDESDSRFFNSSRYSLFIRNKYYLAVTDWILYEKQSNFLNLRKLLLYIYKKNKWSLSITSRLLGITYRFTSVSSMQVQHMCTDQALTFGGLFSTVPRSLVCGLIIWSSA